MRVGAAASPGGATAGAPASATPAATATARRGYLRTPHSGEALRPSRVESAREGRATAARRTQFQFAAGEPRLRVTAVAEAACRCSAAAFSDNRQRGAASVR